jgi:hypothetical protein
MQPAHAEALYSLEADEKEIRSRKIKRKFFKYRDWQVEEYEPV